MRRFIRHPSNIPIQCCLVDIVADQKEYLKNISEGGLCFESTTDLAPGCVILVQIPLVKPAFEARAEVVWTKKVEDHRYEIGVKFLDPSVEFRARMVEQICHIESYKREVFAKQHRRITGEEAALEWIRKYADDFPSLLE